MKRTLLFLAMMFSVCQITAQTSLWQEASPERLSSLTPIRGDKEYSADQQLLVVDMQAFKQSLSAATEVGTGNGLQISLPTTNGTEQFVIWETSNFAPELRAQYPDIKSYVGKGVTDPSAYLRFSVAPVLGVETMILRADSGAEFIEPYTTDYNTYVLFDSKTRIKNNLPFTCGTEDVAMNQEALNIAGQTSRSNNQVFKTFRLALSCTGEYGAYFGGTVAGALAAMNATMTRVNGVLDVDLAVKLEIIANDNLVIYTSGATDPYSAAAAGSGGAWNAELQNNLTNVLGNAAYDIGHLFGASGGGGNAGCIGCICVDDTASTTDKNKGSGFTSPADGIPMGDSFDIDYVIHEMGHQMGANHTFTYEYEGSGVNLEVGSGVTIMGYAGVTGNWDVQSHSIPIYAYRSILQIQTNLVSKTCSVNTTLTNHPPTVSAGLDWTIPNGTAFILTGTGSDQDGDTLNYVWEENDLGTAATIEDASEAAPDKTIGPNWRTFLPTAEPVRILPQLSAVLGGTLRGTWESVSDVGRTLSFNFTARDSHPNGGQTSKDAATITVSPTIGPFEVTSQATAGISWTQGSTQTVAWSVGGTTALLGSNNVDIKLSTDGGLTFPITLAANTPNDGTEDITVPDVTGQACRIWIQPTGNIYFAVNDKPFSIGYSCNTASDTPNLAIPDGTGANVAGALVQSTLTVSQAATIASANMKVNISVDHTYMGDLTIKLKHPNGTTTRTLVQRPCNTVGQFSNANLTFQDGSPTLACTSSPLSGTYAPFQAFSAFNGLATNGTWTITAQDFYNGDTGSLVSWGLDFGCVLGNPQFDHSDFTIYPNPNKGNFAIEYTSPVAGDVTIMVHDIRGRKVFENKYTNTGLFYQNVQLDNAEAGIYMVTVQSGTTRIVKKVVVN